ncbi:MAG TPA: 30S ribosomal protein S1 [Syntrophales bacterium]|jgi:small subunit ribosomal protein S1|nr:30S ribosomal protein S1 [Syntrophales bacterium]HON22269.1 30S ribosomal protein S1 [Syntrophales bacterium]HOU78105.1 30S ribosomal protein S1 [Syntrophales bacterium]HPC33418.1 30S ribosomal protein S1 [Syntrophales bacterium]HQG34724.1 30S ribosomal protein S1 [Syntrophales bacterium]
MTTTQNKDANEEQSFAELFEKSPVRPDFLKPGQKVEAKIVKITDDWIFLDLGGKSEGYLDKKELADEEGAVAVREGDTLTAYFLSSKHNEKLFTTRIGAGDSAREHLEEVWQSGVPVAGVVEKEIKGGFEIKLPGGMRGFCPYSQLGLTRVDKGQDFLGRTLPFQIVEFGERGRNIVLSNRAVLEAERKKEEAALKEKLQEGMIVTGTVVSLRDFGAFIDIGGVQGLLPVSEIGWERVTDIKEHLTVGQTLEVAVTKLDWENGRISLSLKSTLTDPWDGVRTAYPEGTTQRGTVVRLTPFGAFVNLGPGVDGLLHISRLGKGKRIAHPRDAVREGDVLEVRIEAIDGDRKRISLSLADEAPAAAAAEGPAAAREDEDDYRKYLRSGPKTMGSLGDLMKEKTPRGKKRR